jgi:hypothetical protein
MQHFSEIVKWYCKRDAYICLGSSGTLEPARGLLADPSLFGSPGDVEEIMNKVRSELNAKGGNFGERQSYVGKEVLPKKAYIPFDDDSYDRIMNDRAPDPKDKYIEYTPIKK